MDANAGVLSSLTVWQTNSTGINTTSNVGFGTTTASAAITVGAGGTITVGTGVTFESTGQGSFTGIVTASSFRDPSGNALGATGPTGPTGAQGAGGSATLSNNAQYRLITGGSGTNLAGNTYATWNGNNLALRGGQNQNCTIELASDEGDNNNDFWRVMSQHADSALAIDHYATGSWVEKLSITSAGNVNINGTPPWSVVGGNYRNLSISGEGTSASGFLWLGNGTATNNADFDLTRINICNGANIVAQVTGSTDTSANDDGRLVFYTRTTGESSPDERLRISSTGNVSIGTQNTTEGKLQVAGDISAGILHGGRMYGLLAKRKFDGNNSLAGFAMEYASGYESPYIVAYNNTSSPSANNITFGSLTTSDRNLNTGLTKLVEINANSGNTTLKTGNLVIGTSGRGIDFSATSDASGGSAANQDELLDDYESGTFQPLLKRLYGSTESGYYNQNVREGFYTKIGTRVFITGRCHWSGGSTGSGSLILTHLPFTPKSSGTAIGANEVPIVVGYRSGLNYPRITGYLNYANSRFMIQYVDSSGSFGTFDISPSATNNSGHFYFSATYEAT